MKANFAQCLTMVLKHEGGYVNHPTDPGGETNKGVTWRTYNAWRAKQGQPARSVKDITDAELKAIYRLQYWNAILGDNLPSGIDYAVFDFAVNSGPARAAKFLQSVVGVSQDGQIGAITLDAVKQRDPKAVVEALCDSRLAWLKRLRTWSTFGRGWGRRVAEVKAVATQMATGGHAQAGFLSDAMGVTLGQGKGAGAESLSATMQDLIKNPAAMGGVASAATGLATLSNGEGPVQYALAAGLMAVVVVVLFMLVRNQKKEH